jgi:hypothetical protein
MLFTTLMIMVSLFERVTAKVKFFFLVGIVVMNMEERIYLAGDKVQNNERQR